VTSQSTGQQSGLWDVEIVDPELAEALEVIADEEKREVVREVADAKALRKARVKEHALRIRDTVGDDQFTTTGTRVKIGGFVLNIGTRTGGDFTVTPWSSDGVFSQKAID
tara:strand:+ start:325 stop:654 length:330 start_codon:yes stop_codon:yes gene_type:complete